MDINFPLILVVLVVGSGLIWLADLVFLARPRRLRLASVRTQLSGQAVAESDPVYSQALATAEREPALVEYAKSFFPVLAFVLVLRSFLVEPFQIPSASMVPTLQVGDFILVNKFAYGLRLPVTNQKIVAIGEPQRGDVMVFFPPHRPDTYYIKRVIGLPGDEIVIDDGTLYINGNKMTQELQASLPVGQPFYHVMEENLEGVGHPIHKNISPGQLSRSGRWLVPANHYFMMGDNRDNSSDSRQWGPVSGDAIVGKAFAVWMHWDKLLSLPSFSRAGSIE